MPGILRSTGRQTICGCKFFSVGYRQYNIGFVVIVTTRNRIKLSAAKTKLKSKRHYGTLYNRSVDHVTTACVLSVLKKTFYIKGNIIEFLSIEFASGKCLTSRSLNRQPVAYSQNKTKITGRYLLIS